MARRSKALSKRAKHVRDLDVADAVYALVRDNLAARVPGVSARRRGPDKRLIAAAAGGVTALAAALLSRKKVSALLGSGDAGSDVAATPPPAESPSNYDSPRPPADEPVAAATIPEPILDEQAEEAAAAEEAGSIGGHVSYGGGPEPIGEPEDRTDEPELGSATQPEPRHEDEGVKPGDG